MNARKTLAGLFVIGNLAASQHASANVYPTEVVADYVIGCMASNGGTQEMLRRVDSHLRGAVVGDLNARRDSSATREHEGHRGRAQRAGATRRRHRPTPPSR